MARRGKYSPEDKERAVRMVIEHRGDSRWTAVKSIASKVGRSSRPTRGWLAHRLVYLFAACFLTSCAHDENNVVVPPPIDYSLPIGNRYPVWSVDGDSLYYVDIGAIQLTEGGGYKTDPDSAGLRVVARNGGSSRMVFQSGLSPYALSPDGTALCMALGGDLFVGVFAGGKLNRATFEQITTIGGIASPSWSPAGDWIAFDSDYQDPKGAQAIWKVVADGTALTDLSVHGTGEWMMPSWDPTGVRIAYVRYVVPTPTSEIFVMNADGSNSKRLTRNNSMDLFPRFSPDGTHICYESSANGVTTIHVMNINGSQDRVLAIGSMPSWSPKGDEVAYVALTANRNTSGTIWVVSIDGSKSAQVTKTRY